MQVSVHSWNHYHPILFCHFIVSPIFLLVSFFSSFLLSCYYLISLSQVFGELLTSKTARRHFFCRKLLKRRPKTQNHISSFPELLISIPALSWWITPLNFQEQYHLFWGRLNNFPDAYTLAALFSSSSAFSRFREKRW